MHIKICGITNVDDALAALEAGADFLGFNFYPKSPRYISPEGCGRIRAALGAGSPPATLVGLFVNETAEHVAAILADCGLDLAQIHGDEPPDFLAALGGRAFKGLRGLPAGAPVDDFARHGPGQPALLLDAYSPGAYGGTGQTGDWAAARAVAARYPIFLAGGLTAANVAEAIAQARPWGVDVASGVESAPGRKDWRLVRAFVRSARGQGSGGERKQGSSEAREQGRGGAGEQTSRPPLHPDTPAQLREELP